MAAKDRNKKSDEERKEALVKLGKCPHCGADLTRINSGVITGEDVLKNLEAQGQKV